VLFSELGLKSSSLEAVTKLGYTQPTEIQERAIPILLADEVDFIGQAQTGTGKTAAFVLPLLEKIDRKSRDVQCLILAPTRELANQIQEEIKKLSQMEPVRCLAVYGGTSVGGQIRDLKGLKPQIVVGTPGRVMDFIERGVLVFDKTRYVILDEADEMLDMGFFDDVTDIVAAVPEKKIWMFSATMPGPIVNLINEHFCDPVSVKVTKNILTSASIEQKFVVVKGYDQIEALCRILDAEDNFFMIIFTKTKIMAKELTDELNARGYPTDALHGDMSQESRDMTMKKFKDKKISLLVCTDVAARGIDVSDLTHVINFSLPQDNEAYVHRIGRTGRGSSKGIAISIIDPGELSRISQIERITKAKIERVTLPKVDEIKTKILDKAMTRFSTQVSKVTDDSSFELFSSRFQDFDKDQLLKGVYAFFFEQSLKRYQKALDLDLAPRQRGAAGMGAARVDRGMQRFFVNIGRMDGVQPGELIKFLCHHLNIRSNEIGRIDTKEKFAFIEVDVSHADKVLGMKGLLWGQRKISVELAESSPMGHGRGGNGGGGNRGGGRSFGRGGNSSRSRY
jgi:ATP-dependent RNA helicase DeaD